MGDRQFNIFSSKMHLVCPPNFAYALFSFSPGKAVIPRRDKKKNQRLRHIFVWGVGRGRIEANKVHLLWEMCKWRILFISTQEPRVEIIDSVTHFRSKVLFENSKWRRIFLKVIFIRKRHLCWGASDRFYGVILPTFVLFPHDAEFHVFPSTSWYVFM